MRLCVLCAAAALATAAETALSAPPPAEPSRLDQTVGVRRPLKAQSQTAAQAAPALPRGALTGSSALSGSGSPEQDEPSSGDAAGRWVADSAESLGAISSPAVARGAPAEAVEAASDADEAVEAANNLDEAVAAANLTRGVSAAPPVAGVGDVDGDGDLDLLIASNGAHELLLGDGSGAFTSTKLRRNFTARFPSGADFVQPSLNQTANRSQPRLHGGRVIRRPDEPPEPPEPECDADDGIYGCYVAGCTMDCARQMLTTLGCFCVVCMASHTFGGLLSPFGFPGITLFLGFGLLAGPFGFELIRREDELKLRWINDLALGFIGLSAGGKFLLSEIGGALHACLCVLSCLIGVTYLGSIVSSLLLGDYFIPFFGALGFGDKLAASLLIACLAVARSPSSAIAIISEMNAEGPFTTIALAVTVMMDVVVVMLFALTTLVASSLSSQSSSVGSAGPLTVLFSFFAQVVLSGLLGLLIGHALPLILGFLPERRALHMTGSLRTLAVSAFLLVARLFLLLLQRVAMIFTGWALFFEELMDEEFNRWQWQNPLICCMVAGFVIVNFTRAGEGFHDSVHDLSGPIYLFFFTYTGVCMDLGVLTRNVPACVLMFTTRTVCIFLGSWLGATIAEQPSEHRGKYWMAFITQAGVTLGLAQSVSAHFDWGPDFAASIVAVVVCNQIVGPPLFKRVIKLVGEQHHNYDPKKADRPTNPLGLGKTSVEVTGRPQPRGALVVAPEGWEKELIVRRLRALGWEVLSADASLSVSPASHKERQKLEERSQKSIGTLPAAVRQEVRSFSLAPKPWEQLISHRSLPSMKVERRNSREMSGSGPPMPDPRRSVRRTFSFDNRKQHRSAPSLGALLTKPPLPAMPEDAAHNPERYAQCMRLLWLAASMKSFDVLVALLPTDQQNLEICALVADMLPLLQSVHKHQRAPPQVLVTLGDESALESLDLQPQPFVVPMHSALPSLVCEVLHPMAHWSGSLAEGDWPATPSGTSAAPGAFATGAFAPSDEPSDARQRDPGPKKRRKSPLNEPVLQRHESMPTLH